MSELDKLVVLEEFLRNRIWFCDFGANVRLVGMSIKIEPNGLFVILKAITAEGPVVAFTGATDLDGLRRKLQSPEGRSKLKWREDRFALDKNNQVV